MKEKTITMYGGTYSYTRGTDGRLISRTTTGGGVTRTTRYEGGKCVSVTRTYPNGKTKTSRW